MSNDTITMCRIEAGYCNPRITWSASELVAWARNWALDVVGRLDFRASGFRRVASSYRANKEAVRGLALAWQDYERDACMSYGELADWCGLFEKLGRRYGLLSEFRENGIC